MTINLTATHTLAALASAATSITMTVSGDEILTAGSTTTDSFKTLYQGQLPNAAAVVYTVPASSQAIIKTILLANTTGGAVTVTLFVDGLVDANRIVRLSVPAGGSATWTSEGWKTLDSAGAVVTTSLTTITGDATGSGFGTVPLTFATVNANVGTFGSAASVAQVTENAKGLTTAAVSVPIQILPAAVTGFDTQVRTSRLDQMAAPTGPVSFNSQKITSVADATNGTDAPNFAQVQAIAEGRDDKEAVEWSTTGNITLSGLGTQGNGEWTAPITDGTRILVKDQTTSADKGIYDAHAGAWTRSTDANTGAEITGATVLVKQGATNRGDTWRQSATVTTIGSDPQTWVQIGEGDPLSLTAVGVVPNANAASLAGQALTLQPANGTFPGLLSAAGFTNLGNQSGANTGDVSLTASGAVANANGASLAGQSLTLQPASAAFAGLLTAAQFTKLANTSGANTGDVALTAVGAAPNANAATLTGQSLNLQPASASFPGVITSAQFVILSNTSGTNSGNVSLGAVGASPNANGATLTGQALNLELASASFPGAITAAQFTKLANTSGTNTGDQSYTASGDATAPASASNLALTFATVNANVGSFGSASSVGTFNVNAKGLTTAAATVPIVIAESQVTNLVSDLAGKQATGNYLTALTGDLTATGPGSVAGTFATVNSNVGSFGDANHVATFIVNAKGLTTAAALATINPMQGWIDVTLAATPVLTGNTGAQNITAINAILAGAAAGTTIYFPGQIFDFNAAWTMPAGKQFTFQGQGAGGTGGNTLLRWTANVAGDIISLPAGIWYWRFSDLNFCVANGITQSAGALINIKGAAGTNFFNCTFSSIFGGFWNDVLVGDTPGAFPSNQSWNSAIIQNCVFSGYKGRGVYCDSAASSLVVVNSVIQGQWGPTSGSPAAASALAGIEVQNCGALQIGFCDILGNINNLLSDPAVGKVSASVFCNNTYFDSSAGSCIKISGAGATVRARFDTCSFTTAGTNFTTPGTNLSAVEIASTFAYGAGGQGIDFVNCNVLNTFFTTGTSNGFLVSGTADFSIGNSKMAGWTNGVQVTPIATAGRTQFSLNNNTIGPAGGYAGNSVGVLLNAGAAAYGSMNVEGNILEGNTSAPFTDNSTIAVGSIKKITGNVGYMPGLGALPLNNSGGAALIAGRGAVTSGTGLTQLFGARIPANAVPVGQLFKITATTQTSTASAALVLNIYAGPAGTTGDTIVATLPITVAATANMYQTFTGLVEIAALGASNTVAGQSSIIAGAVVASKTAAAEAFSSAPTTAAWYITVAASSSLGTLTVKGAAIEAL